MSVLRFSSRGAILLALSVVVGVLHLQTSPPARAADGICWLDTNGDLTCPSDEPAPVPAVYPPAPLISPQALPPGADAARSLRALEERAVDMTLEQHHLPAEDRDAVQSWARFDALANLWSLIVEAVETPAGERTTDQQHAVDWMSSMGHDQAVHVATSIGEQYVRWAGLNVADYRAKVSAGAGREELTEFMTAKAQPYGSSGSTGYCVYRSPNPYTDEYKGYLVQMCYTPCTSWVCNEPRPSYDQFVRWGAAVASQGMAEPTTSASTASLTWAVAQNSLAETARATAAAAAVGLASWLALADFYPVIGFVGGMIVTTASTVATVSLVGSVIGGAALVLAALVGVILAGVQLFEELTTPEKLAALLVTARTDRFDPQAQLQTDAGRSLMFRLFGAAVSPLPRSDRTCDNLLIPAHLYGSTEEDQATIRDQDGHVVTVWTYPCLNQPPVPATRQDDPHFVVRSMESGKVTAQSSVSVKLAGNDGKPDQVFSLRASGGWWVARSGGTDTQALSVTYTGWDGQPRTASIVKPDAADYGFRGLTHKGFGASVRADTCVADQTCWSGRELRFIGPDGKRYEALLEGPVVSQPLFSRGPSVGRPVLFSANGFGPASAVGVAYEWRFQADGCSGPCTAPITGTVARYTWTKPGTYAVELRATYEEGWPPVTVTVPITVRIPPQLTLAPVTGAGVISGQVAKTRPDQTVHVTVKWGDGHSDASALGPRAIEDPARPVSLEALSDTGVLIRATHSYSSPGVFNGTVTVTDEYGYGMSLPFTQTIEP